MDLWVLVLLGVIGMPTVASVALYRGGLAAGLARRTSVTVAVGAGVLFGGWVLASAALAGAGVYGNVRSVVPWLGVAFAGALVGALLASRIPVVARILAAPGTVTRLAWPQAVRIVGVVFVIAMAQGTLPWPFALWAGLGDMTIGVSTMLLLRRWTPGRAVWLNVMGLVDLVGALTLGFLGGLGAHPILAMTPTTQAVTLLPLALVPTTAVPLATALHIVSLARLRTATRPLAASVPVPMSG